MPIYEYQGKSYDIASDDPAEAKNKILKFLSTGEGESKPVSAQPRPVEGAGGAAFGVYRPAGRRPESQQDREASKDMALQSGRGVLSNAIGLPGMAVDIGNIAYGQAIKPAIDFVGSQISNPRMPRYSDLPPAVQSAGNLLGNTYNTVVRGQEFQPLPQVPKMEKLPGIGEYGMEFYNQYVPFPEPTSPQGQLAFTGSQIAGAPFANKAFQAAMATPKVIRQAGQQFGRGAMEGVANPTYKPSPSTAFAEMGEQYYPNKTVEPFMKMTPEQQVQNLTDLQASQQPSANLFSGFLNKAAQRLAPEGPSGGTLVPLEGRGVQAFAEQTTRDFLNKPSLTNLSGSVGNLGGAVIGGLTGGPVGAAAGFFAPQYVKALELLAQRRLQGTAGLKPGFQQQLAQAQQTAGRLGLEGAQPQTPLLGYNPNQAPIPMGAPPRAVNIEGQRAVLPYQIDTTNSQAARPIAAPITPAQTAQQAAASQVLAPATPLQAAAQQAVAQQTARAPSGFEMSTKPTIEQILAEVNKRKTGVFETAGETPPPPVDLTANRAGFAEKINQHRAGLEETRAQNREAAAGTETNFGRGTEAERLANMTPAERMNYYMTQGTKSEGMSDAAVVKDMIKTTANTGIRRYKNSNIVDNGVFNEFAADAGVILDWKTAPDISKMGFAEGRSAMTDWMYKQVKTEANDLGLDTRTGGIRGQIKAMEEANKNIQEPNPTEVAAAVKAAKERMAKLKPSSSMEMKTGPQLEDITGAAQDVMLQKFETKGERFNTAYTHKGDTVYETKSPGYHSVELEHPDGSRTVFKVHQYGPNAEYTKMTFDKVNRPTPVERSSAPFPDFVTVENVMKTSGGTGTPPSGVMEMRTATPNTVKFGEQELPVSKRKSQWKQDQLFNQLGGESAPTSYREGSNVVIDAPNPNYNINVDGMPLAEPFGRFERNKIAYDVSSGKRAPVKGSKFNPQVDNPFTAEDLSGNKIPKDKAYKHTFFDRQPDAFEANMYSVEINPKGINTAKVNSSDRITEVYNADTIKVYDKTKVDIYAGNVKLPSIGWSPKFHKAERGLTPDNRMIFQTESKHPITDQVIVERYVGGTDISKQHQDWFRANLSDFLPEKDITYVYKPENPAMKTQTFTAEEFKNLPTDTYGDLLPIKDIKKISNRQLGQIFDTKKKGK